MIVATSIPEVNEIMDRADEREFWIVAKEMERPPYWFAEEGLNNRLAKAIRRVQDGQVERLPNGDHVVQGSADRLYVVKGSTCECPQSQKGKSSWCYHRVAVALHTEWQKRVHPTLPLGPTTADERLAQSVPTMPQEDLMDDDPYIPEPPAAQDAPVAILAPVERKEERKESSRGLTPVAPLTDDLEAALQVWTTQRAVVQRFLKQELKPNIDYYTLRIGGKESKPSLSKAGAEKVMGWLKIQASFTPDTGTWEMLGRPQDLVAYVCTLRTRSGEIVGEGRGARSIKKDGGDVNKAIKMAEKSACVSAVLRTGALSDVFTCDLEDLQESETTPTKRTATLPRLTSQEMRQQIWAIVRERAPEATTRDAVEAWVLTQTGLALHPDAYAAILSTLEGQGR